MASNEPFRKVAGVVLAGGRSSRMGRDKAFLAYQGQPLVAHMAGQLREAGLEDIFISGRAGETYPVPGCSLLPDKTLFSGPAQAIKDVMVQLKDYQGVLFVPVDMPLLTPEILQKFIAYKDGCWFEGWPLPVFIPQSAYKEAGSLQAVRALLAAWKIPAIAADSEAQKILVNTNTKADWEALSA